ncbi:MAG: EamA family transporter [Bacteroidetes bacterium]|nr:EamA family transporter [Bacteroidota bacterium]
MRDRIIQNKNFLLIGIILSMLTWGVSWPSAKILSRYGTPVEIAFLRFIFTFFGVLAILKFSHIPVRINKQGYRPLLMA